MAQIYWTTAALIVFVTVCQHVDGRTIVKRATSHIDPHQQELSYDMFRDKRKVDTKFGVKNAILGFVFNGSNSGKGVRFAWETTTKKIPTTTEDVVIFEKDRPVSLEIPDRLFGSSFTLVTNLSTTVGDFMINSAVRAQRLLESMRPFLRGLFGSKGVVIEGPTDKPIFSADDATTASP